MEIDESRLNSRPAFQYPPLNYDLDPFAIRLLRVSPELLDGYIQVELRQAPPGTVDNRPIDESSELVDEEAERCYRCLSYTWGEPPEGREILLNNCTFRVRDNLYEFLGRAQQSFSNENLWIDAVCIDQSNMSERERQVERMDSVYKGATEVLVWLGRFPELEFIVTYLNHPPWSLGTIEMLEKVMIHPYWFRAWITQEIVVAKSVQIIHISGTTAWDKLEKIFHTPDYSKSALLKKIFHVPDHSKSAFVSPPAALWVIRRMYTSACCEPDFWDTLLSRQDGTGCADTRDRLYSVLGLLENGKQMYVSYEEEAKDLFWRAGEHLQIWYSASSWVLQNLLDVSINDLRESLESQPNLRLSMRLHYASSGRFRIPRLRASMRCRLCQFRIPYGRHHQIMMCTSPRSLTRVSASWCSHIFLWPTSKSSNSEISMTLVAKEGPGNDSFWSADLENASLRKPNSTMKVVEAENTHGSTSIQQANNEFPIQDNWTSIQLWGDLLAQLRASENEKLGDKWQILLPAKYILTMIEKVHAAS
jgi:hypothetical protein